MGNATARPKTGSIKAAHFAFGAFVAKGTATRIDDIWIGGSDMFDVELILLPDLRKIVGQEYVSGLGQFIQHFLPLWGGDIDTDAPLAAIGVLDQGMAQPPGIDDTLGGSPGRDSATPASATPANTGSPLKLMLTSPLFTAWPITATNFILVRKQPKNVANAKATQEFFRWIYKSGDAQAKQLDYVPLPDTLVKQIETYWSQNLKY